jgi:Integrase core domain
MERVKRPISSIATSRRSARTCCGWLTSRIFQRGPASSIWPSCSTPSAAGSSGWSIATTLHTQVVLDALGQRRSSGVIHHSDQGSQYTSIEFGKRCREAGVRPSMGSVGDAHDNAMAESFFATLECELLDRRRFKTQAEARIGLVLPWSLFTMRREVILQ